MPVSQSSLNSYITAVLRSMEGAVNNPYAPGFATLAKSGLSFGYMQNDVGSQPVLSATGYSAYTLLQKALTDYGVSPPEKSSILTKAQKHGVTNTYFTESELTTIKDALQADSGLVAAQDQAQAQLITNAVQTLITAAAGFQQGAGVLSANSLDPLAMTLVAGWANRTDGTLTTMIAWLAKNASPGGVTDQNIENYLAQSKQFRSKSLGGNGEPLSAWLVRANAATTSATNSGGFQINYDIDDSDSPQFQITTASGQVIGTFDAGIVTGLGVNDDSIIVMSALGTLTISPSTGIVSFTAANGGAAVIFNGSQLVSLTSAGNVNITTAIGNYSFNQATNVVSLQSGDPFVRGTLANGNPVTLDLSNNFAVIENGVLAYPQRPAATAVVGSHKHQFGLLWISHDRGRRETSGRVRLCGFIRREGHASGQRRGRMVSSTGIPAGVTAAKPGRDAGPTEKNLLARFFQGNDEGHGLVSAHTSRLRVVGDPAKFSGIGGRTTHGCAHDVSLGFGGLG